MNEKVKAYVQHSGKVVEADERFAHVMALTLNPRSKNSEGIIRCITSREGKIGTDDQIDRSVLHKITGKSLEHFEIGKEIHIKFQKEIIRKISQKDFHFLGLEDPDIWVDEKTNLIHLYFTVSFIGATHLGHAFGKNLDNLNMTMPVLMANKKGGAKEVSIVPLNKKGFRYNLVESSDKIKDVYFSVVRTVIARDMNKSWKFGKIIFHPGKQSASWIAGHASPGPILPSTFIDVGKGKLLGIMNGCEANKMVKGKTKYGTFSIGLFIYDYEKGKIDWVSQKPLIQDSQVGKTRAITLASHFVETSLGEGILYAHADDSFVRAYTLYAEGIRALLP